MHVHAPTTMQGHCCNLTLFAIYVIDLHFCHKSETKQITDDMGSSPARCHDMHLDAQAFECMS